MYAVSNDDGCVMIVDDVFICKAVLLCFTSVVYTDYVRNNLLITMIMLFSVLSSNY